MDRRTYLATAGAAGLGALAGCSFLAAAETSPPRVPESLLEAGGWERTGEREETVYEQDVGPTTVVGLSHTLEFEDAALRADVEEKTLGSMSQALSAFFATRIDFSPNLDDLPANVGRREIMNQVRDAAADSFESQLRESGLSAIGRERQRTLTVDTGEEATLTEYAARYAFDGFSFQVTDEQSITLEGDALDIGGGLATWKHGDSILVAGGVYPAENYATSVEKDLSDAITITVDVDLGLTPEAYQEELLELIRAVR